jgi:hypothetical protein
MFWCVGRGRRRAGGGATGDSAIPDAKHANGYAIEDMHTVLVKQNVSEEATRGEGTDKTRQREGTERQNMDSAKCIQPPESCSTGERT